MLYKVSIFCLDSNMCLLTMQGLILKTFSPPVAKKTWDSSSPLSLGSMSCSGGRTSFIILPAGVNFPAVYRKMSQHFEAGGVWGGSAGTVGGEERMRSCESPSVLVEGVKEGAVI